MVIQITGQIRSSFGLLKGHSMIHSYIMHERFGKQEEPFEEKVKQLSAFTFSVSLSTGQKKFT